MLMWRVWWAPNNASKWQMGFYSAFKGLTELCLTVYYLYIIILHNTMGMSHLKPVLEIVWHTLVQFTASSWLCHHHHHHHHHIFHGVGPPVDPFQSHVSRSLFKGLPWFLLPVGGGSISLPWVIYFEAFCLHVVSSFSCITVICPKWVLFLTPMQIVHLFCNLSCCSSHVFRLCCCYSSGVTYFNSLSFTAIEWLPCNV